MASPWWVLNMFQGSIRQTLVVGNFNNYAQYYDFESNETSCETMQICFN
jgi:hypothetical protein